MKTNLKQKFKELFFRREIEIFWDASEKDVYGIRECYRSRFFSCFERYEMARLQRKGSWEHVDTNCSTDE